ncbi:MAG: hypothetical protein AAF529_11365 [Pseudomonadota bacterium]
MRLKYLTRFLLLTVGFALATFGLLNWQARGFELDTLWPLAEQISMHPAYAIVLGLALIPPTLWEIFMLEQVDQSE